MASLLLRLAGYYLQIDTGRDEEQAAAEHDHTGGSFDVVPVEYDVEGSGLLIGFRDGS